MKIKNDFVTNSSSTCYIVDIPDNFYFIHENKELSNKLNKYLEELIDKGQGSYGCWAELSELNLERFSKDGKNSEFDSFNDEVYKEIIENFTIMEIEFGPDCESTIVNINSKYFREKLRIINKEYENKK